MKRHHWILSALLVVTALTAASCVKPTRPEDKDAERQAAAEAKVIARINGEPITLAKFEASLADLPVFLRRSIKGETATRRYFGDLVIFTLLTQEARRQGYDDDPDVLFATRQALAKQLRLNFETKTSIELAPQDIERAAGNLHLTEPRVTLDLIRCLSKERASRLRVAYRMLLAIPSELSPAEIFNRLARFNTDEHVAGTVLGPLERKDAGVTLPVEILEAALDWTGPSVPLPPMVSTAEGTFLYYIVERFEPVAMSPEEARGAARLELIEAERDRLWTQERQRLLKAAQIEIVDESLAGAAALVEH